MDHMMALNVFTRVVELGNFSAAARGMGLSNAAVSKNISQLEASLGIELFSRSTRHMRLTDAGRGYYEKITRVLGDLKEANDAISDMAVEPSGILRVSAPMSFSHVKLTSLIPDFLERYRDISLCLELSDETVDLIAGNFDVALRGSGNLPDSSLVARKVLEIDRVVCASADYLNKYSTPKAPVELLEHKCIIYSYSQELGNWRFKQKKECVKIKVSNTYQVNSSLAIREALMKGAGIAAIPKIYVEEALKAGHLIQVLEDWHLETLSMYIIFASGKHLPKRTRVFIDYLVEKLTSSTMPQ